MILLVVHGVGGRMGRRVADLASRNPEFEIRAGLERRGHPLIGQIVGGCPVVDSFDRAVCLAGKESAGRAVVIDFSSPEALSSLAGLCADHGLALVSGTTGLTPDLERLLDETASRVPVVWAPNMSPGVNLLYRLVRVAARALPGADVEIVEHHHRHKADAPSGTAKGWLRW